MRQFRISDRFTTADIGLDIIGDSLLELFAAAMEGMFAIILGPCVEKDSKASFSIALSAETLEQLLVDWLSELLYRFDAELQVPTACRLEIDRVGERYMLAGSVQFRDFEREKEPSEHEIKAITYYKLQIIETNGILSCHVVFDL
jgi:SHS2 domain-containing protein